MEGTLRRRPGSIRSKGLTLATLSLLLFNGCGGSNSSPPQPPQFIINSGNWTIPFTGGMTVGGQLTQNGNTISGVLHVLGSTCFDPVADELTVNGTVSSDPNAKNALSFSTASLRGQVITMNATWEDFKPQEAPPPTSPQNPIFFLVGNATLMGGNCTGATGGGGTFTDFSGNWVDRLGVEKMSMSQTGPDAQGFFHVSGTISNTPPCFNTGTVTSSSIAGDMNQVTITTDTGQLIGSGHRELSPITTILSPNFFIFNYTVHGGPCDGQAFSIEMDHT